MATRNKMHNLTRLGSLAFATLLIPMVGCHANPAAPADSTAGAASQTASRPADQPAAQGSDHDAKNGANVSVDANAKDANEKHAWTDQQILTCTVSQCWHLAHANEEEFFDIVQKLAAISAQDRNLVLPEDAAAGHKAGEIIKSKAKSDHEQLLYAVVDEAIRKVGKPANANQPAVAGKRAPGR